MCHDLTPIGAVVGAQEHRTVAGAHVEAHVLRVVSAHGIAQHGREETIRQARLRRGPTLTRIDGAPDSCLALRRKTFSATDQREHEHGFRLVRMHHDWKSEVTRQTAGDRSPPVTTVVGTVDPAVVLGKNPARRIRMRGDFVHALPELRLGIGHEVRPDAGVCGVPGRTTVIRPVDPTSRHRYGNVGRVGGIG
jgi:hypothetical protein